MPRKKTTGMIASAKMKKLTTNLEAWATRARATTEAERVVMYRLDRDELSEIVVPRAPWSMENSAPSACMKALFCDCSRTSVLAATAGKVLLAARSRYPGDARRSCTNLTTVSQPRIPRGRRQTRASEAGDGRVWRQTFLLGRDS